MEELIANDPQDKLGDDYLSEKESPNARARIITAVTLTLLPLVFFYPAVMGQLILAPGDGWTQILGNRILIGDMIRNGQLPLWNPYLFSGMPLMAAIQTGAFYPTTWLFAIFSPLAAMNWMVITTYHVALIGAYLYARRIGCNRVGSMIAGIAFAFGGYMTAHLGHTNRIAAAAWLPWIVLAVEELYLEARWRWVALGSLFIALQFLAGEPQMSCYTAIVAGAYGLFSLKLREEKELRRRFLFGSLAMSVCGVLLSAIQLLPGRELLKQGERAALAYDYFAGVSFPPQQLFQLIFPYFYGGVMAPYKIGPWSTASMTETAGYVGMLVMIFGLIALIGHFKQKNPNRLVWFWGGCAVVAMFLALGSYMPFDIHKLLYRVPVYNLFRASGRHLLEFNFACGVMAGLGVTWVSRNRGEVVRRAIRAGIGVMALIVLVTAAAYRHFADYLATGTPPPGAKSTLNPEFLIPIVFFVLSVVAVYLYALFRERSTILKKLTGAAMVALFFADIASFGFFYQWHIIPSNLTESLTDTPTVKFIKEREPDLNSFRVLSYRLPMSGRNYDLLDFPNISIARGLQSANGYDPVYLLRYGAVAGDMSLDGDVRRLTAFGSDDQGFNLLNIKYLLMEQPDIKGDAASIEREGIRFFEQPINFRLEPGSQTGFKVNATANELAIISFMGNSSHIPNGAPVVSVSLYTKDGRVIERQLRAGEHTSEWAYDRSDVRATVKHDRAPVIESFPVDGFQGHQYLARIPFERSEIERVVFKYEREDANVTFQRASFYDAETRGSTPISVASLPDDRWRKLTRFGEVEVYENTKALPRAWFVRRAAVELSADTLQIIKTGKMKDGSPFDPAETVLLERESFGNREAVPPPIGDPANSEAKVTRYEPQRIELQTRNSQPGFLVMSEIYYRGWEAWIDGRRAPVERVNYSLRGLAVPAGEHRIEFVFRAHSFRTGAAWSLLGLLLLLAGASNQARRGLTRMESSMESFIDSVKRSSAYKRALTVSLRRRKDTNNKQGNKLITEDDVVEAYRLLLDRDPENDTVIQFWMEIPDKAALMDAISKSPEFRRKKLARNESPFWYYASSFDAEEVIFRHAAPEVRPSSEHLTNYLGVQIRPHFLPDILSGKEGEVEPVPVPANWHADIAEWGACLRALDLAGDHFTMIELGCGWGCWMNILGVAARQSGRTFRLYGVEADEVHLGYAREALADNGISPENYRLLRGIAGAASGTALFPLIASGADWGGTALFGLDAAEMAARIEAGSHVEIPVADIPALVDEPVDLMHVDIQGAELALLTELYPYLCERVGYVMIGTHTREIEGGLIELFSRDGDWVMEMERGAIHRIIDGRPITICDGVQGWRNIGREARRAGE